MAPLRAPPLGLLSIFRKKPKEGDRSQVPVTVRDANDRETRGELEYYPIYSSTFTKGACCLNLAVGDTTISVSHPYNYFEAMIELRRKLEEQDLSILCWGAKRLVYPTGMQADMGCGLTSSVRDTEGQAFEERSIFDPIERDDSLWTVEETEGFMADLLAAIRQKTRSEQDGADQPATAPESKAE